MRNSGRTSWWPGAIGLAVSRPQSTGTPLQPPPQQNRPTSRLLPAKPSLSSPKPVLSLKIPRIVSPSPPQSRGEGGEYQQTNSQILNERTAKLTAPPRTHYNLPRESTMTEFEEDGAITSARSQRSNNIWRPPSATAGKTPQSAATYYVADKNGNWVLGDPKSATHMAHLAELDASGASAGGGARAKPSYAESAMLAATATKAGIGHGAGSPVAPSVPRMPPAPGLLPPAEIMPANLHQSYSSSVYSPNTTRPNTTVQPPLPQASGSSHPVPSMSFSHPEPPRRRSNSLGRHNSSRSKPPAAASAALSGPSASTGPTTSAAAGAVPKRSDSHDSQASVTTIASSAPSEAEPVVEQSSLSPVVESPASNASPTGRSPVSYPAIPGRTSSKAANNLRLLAPPTRQFAGLPPGQPSPTLGLMSAPPPRGGPYMASYDVPRKPVARLRPAPDPARVATGSPSLRLVTPSPPSDTEPRETSRPPQMKPLYPPPLQPQRARLERGDPHPQAQTAQIQQMPPNVEPQSATVHRALWGDMPPRPLPNPSPDQTRPQPPPRSLRRRSQQQRQSVQRPLPEQSPPPKQPLPSRPSTASPTSPHHIASQTFSPPAASVPPTVSVRPASEAASVATTPSTTSSLLSKRLGTERAAALAPLQHNANGGLRHSPNWRPYRPNAAGGGDVLFSPDEFFAPPPPVPRSRPRGNDGGDLGLPATPTWQPKLTPTRRGDDLFLNVQ